MAEVDPSGGCPEPPFPLAGLRSALWRRMWAQPVARVWADIDVAPLARLVVLQTSPEAFTDRGLLAELRQLEDRFFLSPRARREGGSTGGDDDDNAAGDAWIDGL